MFNMSHLNVIDTYEKYLSAIQNPLSFIKKTD